MARGRFEGLCAGGPHDGKMLAGEYDIVKIAIAPSPLKFFKPDDEPLPPPKIGSGEYVFNSTIGMWIWKREWPLNDHH